MDILQEMENIGFAPSVVTYNSSISAYASDGLFVEMMELKTQMVGKGIMPDAFTCTTLVSGFKNLRKMNLQ